MLIKFARKQEDCGSIKDQFHRQKKGGQYREPQPLANILGTLQVLVN